MSEAAPPDQELNEEQALALFDTPESPDTPPPAEPAASAPPAADDSPPAPSDPSQTAAPQVPAWFAEVPESERPKLIEGLTPDQLRELGPVKELLSQAQQQAIQQANYQQELQQAAAQGDAEVVRSLNDFITKADDLGLKDEAEKVIVNARARESKVIDATITQSFNHFTANQLGVKELPAPVAQQLSQAKSFADYTQHMLAFVANAAYGMGKAQTTKGEKVADEAQQVADRARMKTEILNELAKDGRIVIEDGVVLPAQTPPVLSGVATARGGGPVAVGENASIDELFSAAAQNLQQMKVRR